MWPFKSREQRTREFWEKLYGPYEKRDQALSNVNVDEEKEKYRSYFYQRMHISEERRSYNLSVIGTSIYASLGLLYSGLSLYQILGDHEKALYLTFFDALFTGYLGFMGYKTGKEALAMKKKKNELEQKVETLARELNPEIVSELDKIAC